MTILMGRCHCGNIELRFTTSFTTDELPLRACQCSFCRAHGAVTATDSKGHVSIVVTEPNQIQRYRFGLGITDFLLCARCGVFVAAIMDIDGAPFASINTNVLEARGQLRMPIQPMDYANETVLQRRTRRKRNWTPATFERLGAE